MATVLDRNLDNQQLTPAGRACKEALQTVQVLAAKLETIRTVRAGDSLQLQFGICEQCE